MDSSSRICASVICARTATSEPKAAVNAPKLHNFLTLERIFMLVEEVRVHVGAVDRFVATGGPAGAALDETGVRNFADHEVAGQDIGTLDLQVALEAKIVVALDEELAIDRAVRAMAGGAAFA